MGVKFIMPIYLQPVAEEKESVEVEGNTIGECLKIVIKKYPAMKKMLMDNKGKLHNYVGVYINGQDAYPNELEKAVKPGDEVHILYTLAGG